MVGPSVKTWNLIVRFPDNTSRRFSIAESAWPEDVCKMLGARMGLKSVQGMAISIHFDQLDFQRTLLMPELPMRTNTVLGRKQEMTELQKIPLQHAKPLKNLCESMLPRRRIGNGREPECYEQFKPPMYPTMTTGWHKRWMPSDPWYVFVASGAFVCNVKFERTNWRTVVVGGDEVADRKFHYHQQVSDGGPFARGWYSTFCNTKLAARLAALQLRVEYGPQAMVEAAALKVHGSDQTNNDDDGMFVETFVELLLSRFIPRMASYAKTASQWWELVTDAFNKDERLSADEAKSAFLKLVSQLPTFGCLFTLVKVVNKDNQNFRPPVVQTAGIPATFMLGINSNGLFVLDPVTGKLLTRKILDFGPCPTGGIQTEDFVLDPVTGKLLTRKILDFGPCPTGGIQTEDEVEEDIVFPFDRVIDVPLADVATRKSKTQPSCVLYLQDAFEEIPLELDAVPRGDLHELPYDWPSTNPSNETVLGRIKEHLDLLPPHPKKFTIGRSQKKKKSGVVPEPTAARNVTCIACTFINRIGAGRRHRTTCEMCNVALPRPPAAGDAPGLHPESVGEKIVVVQRTGSSEAARQAHFGIMESTEL
jgi:hypothetical protein